MNTIDAAIHRAAIERLGCVDVSVVRYVAKAGGYYWTNHGERIDVGGGTWYAMAIKPRPGDEWEQVCRRRTKAELLEMIDQRARNSLVGVTPSQAPVGPAFAA
jgi:hypothetical protein